MPCCGKSARSGWVSSTPATSTVSAALTIGLARGGSLHGGAWLEPIASGATPAGGGAARAPAAGSAADPGPAWGVPSHGGDDAPRSPGVAAGEARRPAARVADDVPRLPPGVVGRGDQAATLPDLHLRVPVRPGGQGVLRRGVRPVGERSRYSHRLDLQPAQQPGSRDRRGAAEPVGRRRGGSRLRLRHGGDRHLASGARAARPLGALQPAALRRHRLSARDGSTRTGRGRPASSRRGPNRRRSRRCSTRSRPRERPSR